MLHAQHLQQRRHRPGSVVAALDKALAIYPDSQTILYERAKAHAAAQSWDLALADAERAAAQAPAHTEMQLFYARLLTFQDRTAEALAVLEKARRNEPKNEELYTTMVHLHLQDKDYPAVERVLKQLLRHDPKNYIATFYLGNLYDIYMQRYAHAERMYKRAVAIDPNDPQAYHSLGEMYLEQERLAEALATFLEIESHVVGNASVQLRMAVLHYELGDHAAAIRRIQSILSVEPNEHKLRYYLGVIQEEAGQVADAVAAYRLIPAQSEYFKDAQLRLVGQLQNQGSLDAAIAVLQRALKRNDRVPEFYEFLAYLYQVQGDNDGAHAVLMRAVKAYPENVSFLLSLSLSYDQQDKARRAVKTMRRVLEIDPKHVASLNYIGYMLTEWGERLDEAESMLRTAVQLDPGNPHVIDSLAWLLYKQGEYEEAHHYIVLADQLLPNNPHVLRHWGQIEMARKHEGQAAELFRRAQRIWQQTAEPEADEVELLEKLINSLVV